MQFGQTLPILSIESFADCWVDANKNGYDFIELSANKVADLSEGDFHFVKQIVDQSTLKVPVFNDFVPSTMKLTGPDVQQEEIHDYMELVCSRVSQLGGKQIIFDSAAARYFPQGFMKQQAKQQLDDFLHVCEMMAAKYSLLIALESANRREDNLMYYVEDALEYIISLYSPHLRVSIHTYHMFKQREPLDSIEDAIELNLLSHVHIPIVNLCTIGQAEDGKIDIPSLFSILKQSGYEGMISNEYAMEQTEEERKQWLREMRKQWEEA